MEAALLNMLSAAVLRLLLLTKPDMLFLCFDPFKQWSIFCCEHNRLSLWSEWLRWGAGGCFVCLGDVATDRILISFFLGFKIHALLEG